MNNDFKEAGKMLLVLGVNLAGFLYLNKRIDRDHRNILQLSANSDLSAGAINDILTHLQMDDKFFIYNAMTGQKYRGIL